MEGETEALKSFPGWASVCLLGNYLRCLGHLLKEVVFELHYMEQFFIDMHSIYSFCCQISFFVICETAFNNQLASDKMVLSALTTMLFYSILAYFISKFRDCWFKNRIRFQATNWKLCSIWFCKLVVEWIKAILVIFCLKEHGIVYHPRFYYSLLTFLYFACTEKIFIKLLPTVVEYLNLSYFENLEHLYIPLTLNLTSVWISASLSCYLLVWQFSTFSTVGLYFTTYLKLKDAYFNYWRLIKLEKKMYERFQVASSEDIDKWNDICAVCLNKLEEARITPCKHLFHFCCLKQCLKTSFKCPLCNTNFLEIDLLSNAQH